MTDASSDITGLLQDLHLAGRDAADLLFERLYEPLRSVAARRLRSEGAGHTLSPTALGHEAYVDLVRMDDFPWENRQQFFAVAARAMRNILVDHARRRRTLKRGGSARQLTLEAGMIGEPVASALDWDELLTADRALTDLFALDERQGWVVEMRLFGGLTHPEIAEALRVSVATVERDWHPGRAYLAGALGQRA